MKRWLRRFGYLVIVIVWLMIMCFPTFAFSLAMNEQLQLGSMEGNHLRFFMVNEEAGDGVGVELTRPMLFSDCRKTSVTYRRWEGSSLQQSASFCQCFDATTGDPLPVTPDSCG